MLLAMETYLRQARRELERLTRNSRVQLAAETAAWGAGGLLLTAADLGGYPQPVAMGMVCGLTGRRAVTAALGAAAGYRLFWGSRGIQGAVWILAAVALTLFWGKEQQRQFPMLLPAAAALEVSLVGLAFQLLGPVQVPLRIYLTGIGIAAGTALLARQVFEARDSLARWLAGGVAVLALAPVVPLPGVGLGYVAAGAMTLACPFPGAVLAGLGLDLARVTAMPMAAVVSCGYFIRQVPAGRHWLRGLAPGISYLAVSALWGHWDPAPLPGLVAGGALGCLLPARPESLHRRGETGAAQVRLEMAAGIMASTRQLLLEHTPPQPDPEAIMQKVRDRACGSCSARGACREQERLKADMLRYPLEFTCRKTGRVLGELRRGQEQLRSLTGLRQRQLEYRTALGQQYRFLGEYLQRLSDQLGRRGDRTRARYRMEAACRSRGKEPVNGDTCLAFPGTGCRYYVLLCDGMGTGGAAARESRSMAELLKQLLVCGFPADSAMGCVNNLLALGDKAGAVTVDITEVRLDTGQAAIYKWGAASGWILRPRGPERIGGGGAPPGIRVEEGREPVVRLFLGRGETLVMASDGIRPDRILSLPENAPELPPGELARRLLEDREESWGDDATVAVLRLVPAAEAWGKGTPSPTDRRGCIS